MALKVTYEWIVEQMDAEGDIYDTSAFDTLPEAQAFAALCDMPCDIGLRRDRGDDLNGIVDRGTAYSGDARFDDGAEVPQRFRALLDSLPTCAHFNPHGAA
jgi:hypothetical protein